MASNDFPCWSKPPTPELRIALGAQELALFREYYSATKAFDRASWITGQDLTTYERRCDAADQAIIRFQSENPLRPLDE